MSFRRRYTILLKLALAAFLLGLLFSRVADSRSVLESLVGSRVDWLLAMYGIMILAHLYQAGIMRAVLKRAGTEVGLVKIALINALSKMYSLVMPGDVVAGAAKWKVLADETGRGAIVFNSIVYNRFVLLIAPLSVGGIALALANPLPGVPLPLIAGVALLGMAGGMALALSRRTAGAFDRVLKSLVRIAPGRVESVLEKVLRALEGLRGMTYRQHAGFLVAGLVDFAISILGFWAAAHALSLGLPLPTIIWVQSAILLLGLLPISFANLGVREGVLVLVLGLYGVEAERAIALGLLLFSRLLVAAGVGGVYQGYLLFSPSRDVDFGRDRVTGGR